ncbi:MAG TPA: DNA polymerase IV [Solirubrobacteraceae bacterium]|jgi:DNA polymerase-4|nr:DNA polymerase IV [Solirubrobacteraceae bacterium]
MTAPRRVIAHLDIDAFYASVELQRHPEARGLPLVVAGSGPRSVVTTASYEARRYGIDSAMPAARARVLCPDAIFIAPDFAAYRAKSREVWDIVRARFETVGQAGIDEAYLELTALERPLPALRELVAQVRADTGLQVSVGVGPSRLVAKTASSAFKPAAFVAMGREQAAAHFAAHPVRLLQGIGPKTAERLAAIGVKTVGDLQTGDVELLAQRFGERQARALNARANFHDDSPVETSRIAKSRSSELTFPADVSDRAKLEETLAELARELGEGLRTRRRRARTVAVKVRLDDWTTVTRARTLPYFTDEGATIAGTALELLRAYAPPRPVRLLGVRVASFDDEPQGAPATSASAQLALRI